MTWRIEFSNYQMVEPGPDYDTIYEPWQAPVGFCRVVRRSLKPEATADVWVYADSDNQAQLTPTIGSGCSPDGDWDWCS